MTLKRLSAALLAGLVVVGLTACSDDSSESGGGSDSGVAPEKVVTIGVEAPLVAGATEFGLGIRNSVQLAVDQANAAKLIPGWTIKVKAVDDSSDPAIGKKNSKDLVEDPSVVAVIGTYNSGVAAVVAPELNAAGIAMLSPGNTNPTLTLGEDPASPTRPFDNYFRMVANDSQQGGFLAGYAYVDAGFRTAAVISEDKAVSRGLARDFRRGFLAAGGKVPVLEFVPGVDDSLFEPAVEKATAANPDAIFFGGEYPKGIILKKDALAAGLDVPLMGGDGIQSPDYISGVGAAGANGDVASSVGAPIAQAPNGDAFEAAYEAAGFDDPPSNFGPYAYDATAIVLQVLTTALKDVDRVDSNVRAAVIAGVGKATTEPVAAVERTLNNAPDGFVKGAVTGAIGFDDFGDTTNPVLTIYTVKDGEWTPVVTRQFAD